MKLLACALAWIATAFILAAGGAQAQNLPSTYLPIMPQCNGELIGTGSTTVPVSCIDLTTRANTWNTSQTFSSPNVGIILSSTAGAARQIQWRTGSTAIWSLALNSASDNILGINAFNPSGGAYLGSPFQFSSTPTGQQTITRQWYENVGVSAAATAGGVMGINEVYTNTGGQGSQAKKTGYFSNSGNAAVGGFDLLNTEIANWNSAVFPSSGQMGQEVDWRVGLTPSVPGANWSTALEEFNLVNRSADHGYNFTKGIGNGTTGILMVPETSTFGLLNSQGVAGNTYNADVGFMLSDSGGTNPLTGVNNAWYSGLMCSQESLVGQYGRCITADGDITSTPSRNPGSPMSVYSAFVNGIDTAQATFVTNMALRAGAGQVVGITDGSVLSAAITSGGGGVSYGTSLTGTLTWSGAGNYACATPPVINVSTNSSGVITTINSITTAGSCKELPAPYAQFWTAGGGLSNGTGAMLTLTYDIAGMSSTGSGATLAPTFVADGSVQFQAAAVSGANTPLIFAGGVNGTSAAKISVATNSMQIQSGNQVNIIGPGLLTMGAVSFNALSITTTNFILAAENGDEIMGQGTALGNSATTFFLSPPFTNGTPTGTPAQNSIPNLEWNDTTGTINVWSPHTGTWLHVTLSAPAG